MKGISLLLIAFMVNFIPHSLYAFKLAQISKLVLRRTGLIMKSSTQSLQDNTVLFNSLSRSKEVFRPIQPGNVSFYSCGPTVYDYAHIGNFRAFLTYDILKRWLCYIGYKVCHVCNLTDIDDKIIRRMLEEKKSLVELTTEFITAFFHDLELMNIVKADCYPKATEYIPQMQNMIDKLLTNDYAYKSDDGSVYFEVNKFKSYGKLLPERRLAALKDTFERTDYYELNFVLWKGYNANSLEHSTVLWNASFGPGRPGWHIECSAMSQSLLGETIDLHAGGIDLLFPHHTNEIAQSEAYSGKPFCNYWIHNEFIKINQEKMSKSLKNFKTLRDLVKDPLDARALRYFIVSSHYRHILNYNEQAIEAAKTVIQKLDTVVMNLEALSQQHVFSSQSSTTAIETAATTEPQDPIVQQCLQKFEQAMCEDLNTPKAIACLHELLQYGNKLYVQQQHNKQREKEGVRCEEQRAAEILQAIKKMDKVFGLLYEPKVIINETENESKKSITMSFTEAEALADKRWTLKNQKEYQQADDVRKVLLEHGYVIVDRKDSYEVKIQS